MIHRKGTPHQVPDALSSIIEKNEDEVAAFETVYNAWYLKRRELVRNHPQSFPGCKLENELVYLSRINPLLTPITESEEN